MTVSIDELVCGLGVVLQRLELKVVGAEVLLLNPTTLCLDLRPDMVGLLLQATDDQHLRRGVTLGFRDSGKCLTGYLIGSLTLCVLGLKRRQDRAQRHPESTVGITPRTLDLRETVAVTMAVVKLVVDDRLVSGCETVNAVTVNSDAHLDLDLLFPTTAGQGESSTERPTILVTLTRHMKLPNAGKHLCRFEVLETF